MRKRFHHCHQLNTMDCGPACLQMVARHYGRYYRLETLREKCFITREGVSMLGISDAAESIGMRSTGVRTGLKELRERAPLPCVLHWRNMHFVVLYRIRKGRKGWLYDIADPASQLVTYKEPEFLDCWKSAVDSQGDPLGLALLLEPTPRFYEMEEEEETPGKRTLGYYARYFLPYKMLVGQILMGMLLGSVIQLAFPFLAQAMVDVGIGQRNLHFITAILLAQFMLFVSQLVVGFLRSWIMLHINTRIDVTLISEFLANLMRKPLRFFDSKKTGDILQRIGDHGRIKSFLMGNSVNILFSFVNFLIFTFVMGLYSRLVLAIFMTGHLFYVLWVFFFLKYRRELDIKRFNQSANEQSNLIQLVQGMQEIKLNNCERQKRWEWEHIQVKLFRISVRSLAIGQIQQVGSSFFTQGTGILISYIAARSVVQGEMTLGMMMSLTYIMGQVAAPINDFISFIQNLQDARISLERLSEINDTETEDDMHGEESINTLPEDHTIKLENVTFSYSGARRDYALEDVSIEIPAHKVTAIVGASGSGKTTLLKLLLGFYRPLEGQIKVGNTHLRRINPHLWRAHTGCVMQDGFIFSDTITNNIAVSEEEVDRQKMLQAVDIANVNDFIESLPMGFSTKIGMEGNGVSQGQRQRILIARAVYKSPDFIFFDEATNALDANNERIIMEKLTEFYKGRTVVIVAHRLSTVYNADKIIVLENGHVAEEGTHTSLTEKKGKYYTLVKNQLELGNS